MVGKFAGEVLAYRRRTAFAVKLVAMSAAMAACAAARADGPRNVDWDLRGGNADSQHFAAIDAITLANVNDLGLALSIDLPAPDGSVGTPIIVDGVAYLSSTMNLVQAIDLRTGQLKWVFDPEVRFAGKIIPSWGARVTRGVGYAEGKVLLTTGDCRLIAVDASSGTKVWETQVCPAGDDYTITSAPRVGAGLVFVGPNNADFGTRRLYVDAYDVKTGKRVWRFHTIPGGTEDADKPYMKMAAATWDPDFLTHNAGGSAWEELTYDPVTDLLYIGIGGPTPWNPEERGVKRGDELFTNSIVAVKAKTGEYVWHYQVTPGDAWNFEPTMPRTIANVVVDGKPRRVLIDAPKNGFLYVLDVTTGKLVNTPRNYVPVNWAKGIDPVMGRPIVDPMAEYWKRPDATAVINPGPLGSHNFQPMSYSPATGLVYIPAMHLTSKIKVVRTGVTSFGGELQNDLTYGLKDSYFKVVAWDPVQQKLAWETPASVSSNGGVLTTKGGLMFVGSADGHLRGYNAATGAKVWDFATGSPIYSAPVSVKVDGEQYIVVVTGHGGTSAVVRDSPRLMSRNSPNGTPHLFAFKLGAKGVIAAAAPPEPFAMPALPRPDASMAAAGAELFTSASCSMCHGENAQAIPGSVPDLRRSSAETFAAYESIVRGGARIQAGMPKFADMLGPQDVQKVRAYVIGQAWDAYDRQQAASVPAAASIRAKPPAAFAVCTVCHASGGERNGVGPMLRGVVGRKAAGVSAFAYSAAMRATPIVWSRENLDRFLRDPRKLVPGTAMGFPGISDSAQRAEIVRYLEALK